MKKNLSIIFTSVFFSLTVISCSRQISPVSMNVMGTLCTINAFEDGSERLYKEAFKILSDVEKTFSANDSSSELNRVNEKAGISPHVVSNELYSLVKKSLYYASLSDGDFDPTIGPLVKLWGIGSENKRVPLQSEIDSALSLVDWKKVILSEKENGDKTIFLLQKGMALDLGGIAKGYAADEIVSLFKRKKVRAAVINLGGNVYVFGKKKDASSWKVGVKNPFDSEGEPLLLLSLKEGTSVVTSGAYERFFIKDGKRYHHILNPHTGYPAVSDCSGATIVSSSSADADALSTIAFIQGTKKISALLEEVNTTLSNADSASAILISNQGKVFSSSALKNVLSPYENDSLSFVWF